MNLLDQLSKVSSTIDKQQIIKHISYDEWKTFIYAYDPYRVFNMRFHNANIGKLGEPSEEMFTLLDTILNKEYIGNLAKDKVNSFCLHNGDLIKRIINKHLHCGVSATLFNKVHPKSIPQFKVQLAKAVPIDKLEFPLLLQLKYDGVRIIAINANQVVKFFTRNGLEVNLPHLKEVIEATPMENFILDGEITIDNNGLHDRPKVAGMINSAIHGGTIDESELTFNCFDFMTRSQWEEQNCTDIYKTRFTFLKNVIKEINSPQIIVAFTNEAYNADAVNELYTGAIKMGYEGLILKQEDHKYTFKRSKDWVKLKEVKDTDLKCIAIQTGTGKYEGMIGALICEGIIGGREIKVNVGTGLSDIERGLPYNEYIYKIVEVQYNAVIQDKVTGQWSLFLPRFIGIRFDKLPNKIWAPDIIRD